MFGLGTSELIVILIIALIVFGPQRLPQIGGAIGKSIKEFKKSMSDTDDDKKNDAAISAGEAEKKPGPGEEKKE
ncbi:MAG TPA: twin-arginine translocase TatA/TatE family subunit [Candidatus Wallbacteria bacterium]|nr:twin-arginine translocase TatA/TatE family subunit [Candidatus Wallbacteria bacterium]